MLDSLIAIVIILFILSVITEKVITYIRNYTQEARWVLLAICIYLMYSATLCINKSNWYFFAVFYMVIFLLIIVTHYRTFSQRKPQNALTHKAKDLYLGWVKWRQGFLPNIDKKNADKEDPLTELHVLLLSIFIGTLISFIFKANLFDLITTNNPHESLGWKNGAITTNKFGQIDFSKSIFTLHHHFYQLLGILITGFFLSFGSKFFHDLLDILFLSKRYRRLMKNPELYKLESIKELKKAMASGSLSNAEKAYQDQRHYFESHENVDKVLLGSSVRSGRQVPTFFVHLSDNNDRDLPKSVILDRKENRGFRFPVKYVHNVIRATIHDFSPGDAISSIDQPHEKFGTIGCCTLLNSRSQKYLVTCSHVINSGNSNAAHRYFWGNDAPMVQVFDKLTNEIRQEKVFLDLRHEIYDVALIGPLTGEYSNVLKDGPREYDITASRRIVDEDITNEIKIGFYGKKSKFQEGNIASKAVSSLRIAYRDNPDVLMQNLIAIGRKVNDQWQPVAQKGDSGSVVFELSTGMALGIIVAGDDQHAYMFQIHDFLQSQSMSVFNQTIDIQSINN